MAALIRKQMPPIKKRIKSQITEARAIEKKMAENPADCQIQANRLLVKLQKNAIAYEELDKQLVEKAANDDGESARILEEAEATAELMLETNDAITDLELLINEIKESEKLNKEAEKEKLNIEFEQKLRITQMEKEMEFRETIERECAIKRELEMATRSEIRTTSTLSVRLPKLDFAKFNGNILKWQEFWDSFEAAIHENISLKAVDKLNYLKAQLTGEATNVLSGLELTNENYEVAVNILKCRYGKKNVLINAHYSALMDLPIARNQTNRLREVTDSIEKHLRSLEALGEDINHHYFTSMIMSKLPKEIILKLEEQKDNDDWSVQELRGKIQKILAAKEIVDYQMSSNVENKGINEVQNKMRFTNRTTTETLFTGGAVNTENKKLNNKGCIYCKKKNHWSDECYKYASINERKQIIKGACYICLKKGHMQKDCKLNKLCIYCNQKQNHHRSLCPKKFPNYRRENAGAAIEVPVGIQQNDELTNEGENSLLAGGERVLLQTATTIIKNSTNGKETLTKLILDTGSQRSYISEGMVDLLKLNKKSVETLSVFTFGSQKPKIIKTPIVEIEIQLMNKTNMKINVNVVPQITGRIQQASFDLNKLTYLCKQLPLADKQIENSEIKNIGLLLGNDYYWDIITSEKIKIKPGLYLIGSTLGWILSGRITEDDNKLTPSMMLLTYSGDTQCDTYPFCKIDQALSQQFNENEWWDLQTIGIKDGFEVNEDDKALQNFNDTIKYYNKRYLVTWPWKDLEQNLKENYHLAHGRLMSLLKRYKDRPDIIEKYDATIKDQLNKGIIEIVNKQTEQGTKKHYIPHHAVINPSKTTTSLRIVYDGSAKANKKDKSINECLYRGPVMLENMCGLLMRFRMNRIAVVADIEKAFLQVGLQPGERDVTRFLWLKDSKEPGIQENIQIYRFTRVPFGIISSPFLLSATIRYHLKQKDSETANKLLNNIYVDNIITGFNKVNQAVEFYKQTKSIFDDANMNIYEWTSNSTDFVKQIPLQDRIAGHQIKVLGMLWDTKQDTLTVVNSSHNQFDINTTKRQILKSVSMIFDPLGYFSPTILIAKLFIQLLWKDGIEWDKELGKERLFTWQSIVEQLKPISDLPMKRFIGKGFQIEGKYLYDLHCFTDASKQAYAAAIYLVITDMDSVTAYLLFSRTRLAPGGNITIPRLELLGVLIGTRCLSFVENNLGFPINRKHLWTDSQCVLHWLNSKKTLSLFVERRIDEIKRHPDIKFYYLPSGENPADLATRGKSSSELYDIKLWWEGPQWLCEAEEKWPDINLLQPGKDEQEEIGKEVRGARIYEASILTIDKAKMEKEDVTVASPFGIEEDRFATLSKLIRITAWVARFIKLIRKSTIEKGTLTVIELEDAKELWEKYVQKKYLGEVIQATVHGKEHLLKKQLGLWMDEKHILRCSGRLINAQLADDAKFPKLLPRKAHFTRMVIKDCHERLYHVGVSHVLSQIRNEYWIPRGRAEVYRVIKSCFRCNKYDGGPFRMPDMPPWPQSRVTIAPPFTHTGLDYLGPLYVKEGNHTRKVWICLFTCLVVRAVHLELVGDMTAEEFLMCLRRFIARRGIPCQILSDNASQFKLTKSVIDKAWVNSIQSEETKNYCTQRGIAWKFIVEMAPWMGGFYERLVRLVKQSLRKSLGKICLTRVQLETVVCEIESVINSRPLIYVGSDFESGEVLTPAKFLTLGAGTGVPVTKATAFNESDYTNLGSKDKLLYMWDKGQRLLDSFWRIWRDGYLLSLRERFQRRIKEPRSTANHDPKIGEVIQIKDNLPRGTWRIARIKDFLVSQDGNIRAAKIILPHGRILSRAIGHLYPLECEQSLSEAKLPVEASSPNTKLESVPPVGNEGNPSSGRPVRKSAIEAKKKMQKWLDENFVGLWSVAMIAR